MGLFQLDSVQNLVMADHMFVTYLVFSSPPLPIIFTPPPPPPPPPQKKTIKHL